MFPIGDGVYSGYPEVVCQGRVKSGRVVHGVWFYTGSECIVLYQRDYWSDAYGEWLFEMTGVCGGGGGG